MSVAARCYVAMAALALSSAVITPLGPALPGTYPMGAPASMRISMILYPVILLVVAAGLLRGSRIAFWTSVVVTGLWLTSSIFGSTTTLTTANYTFDAAPPSHAWLTAGLLLGQAQFLVLLSVIAIPLVLLVNPTSRRFFTRKAIGESPQ